MRGKSINIVYQWNKFYRTLKSFYLQRENDQETPEFLQTRIGLFKSVFFFLHITMFMVMFSRLYEGLVLSLKYLKTDCKSIHSLPCPIF